MQRIAFLLFCLAFLNVQANAQDDLFGTKEDQQVKLHSGWVIGANGDYDISMGDMAKRFGNNFRIGGSISYKTKSNWMFGAKGDFIFGSKIKEDSLMSNITTDGAFLDQNGQLLNAGIAERGYMLGFQAGKIINLTKKKSDNGLLVMTGAGFIQHKIRIWDKDGTIPEIRGQYVKGYDRLTNGWYLEQYVGYNHFGNSGFFNYHIGLDFVAAFTEGRRSWLFDVNRPDNTPRLDMLFGIRAGWYLPIFHRKSEDYYFE
jgi:hypothetical protein